MSTKESTKESRTDRFLAASLVSVGSRGQFGVAMVLITMLPVLTLFYLFHGGRAARALPESAIWVIVAILIGMVCLGYGLLLKYPLTIINLRRYMESAARGEMPDAVDLPDGESDLVAIKEYFNLIISQMSRRVAVIQEQQVALIEAERQRVMTESLCTACHHLGQPATSITCYLDLLNNELMTPTGTGYLASCIQAAEEMRRILGELKNITVYRTEPYCVLPDEPEATSQKIIQASGDKAVRSPRSGDGSSDGRCDGFCEAVRVEATAPALLGSAPKPVLKAAHA